MLHLYVICGQERLLYSHSDFTQWLERRQHSVTDEADLRQRRGRRWQEGFSLEPPSKIQRVLARTVNLPLLHKRKSEKQAEQFQFWHSETLIHLDVTSL